MNSHLQNSLKINEAKIVQKSFSELPEINMRETYAIDVAKTIYPKIAFPSHRGGFEKKFIQFVDSDSKVKCFMKSYCYMPLESHNSILYYHLHILHPH
jgi:type III restriction enzyme